MNESEFAPQQIYSNHIAAKHDTKYVLLNVSARWQEVPYWLNRS